MRHLLITAMTLLLYPSVGFGQGSGHDRAAEGIYDSRDRQAETKSVIEALLGVYLVHPPRRHQSERVRSKRGHFTVDLWHPVGDSTDQELKPELFNGCSSVVPNMPKAREQSSVNASDVKRFEFEIPRSHPTGDPWAKTYETERKDQSVLVHQSDSSRI